jgi:phage terminase small subunit
VAKQDKLTPEEERFVEEYLIDLNATQAYLRAYGKCSYSTASTNSSVLLKKTKIRREIDAAQRDYQRRCRITATKVLNEAAGIAFTDAGDLFDLASDSPKLRSVRQIPVRTRRAISSIKVKKTPTYGYEDGKKVRMPADEEVVEIKFCDKNAALEKLMKHLGLAKEITPLDALLAALGPELGEQVRQALSTPVPAGGGEAGDGG